jgi:hypothetical protein
VTARGIPDGCPECVGRPVKPFRTVPDGEDGLRCWYRCPRCLWSWWTSWDTRGREDDIATGGAA